MEILTLKTFGFLKKFLLLSGIMNLSSACFAGEISIVASNTILADMAKEITGNRVEIHSLIGPDEEAHAFSPRPSDLKTISSSNLFIINGYNLEGWLQKLGLNIKTIEAAKGIKPIRKNGETDPHAWSSALNAPVYIDNITYAICAEIPVHCNEFKENASNYKNRIAELAESYIAKFEQIPSDKRKAITTHDAFSYLARDFGIRFVPVKGVNEETEISAKILADIIKQIKTSEIRIIFIENISNTHFAKQLSQETSAVIGGKLYSDALSKDDKANSYYKLLESNLKTIYEALSSAK